MGQVFEYNQRRKRKTMNDRYIDSMAYLLVDSVTGVSRRKPRRGRETKIIALKRAQGRLKKPDVSTSRWNDLWKNLFGTK
jgi:hypothetical protein